VITDVNVLDEVASGRSTTEGASFSTVTNILHRDVAGQLLRQQTHKYESLFPPLFEVPIRGWDVRQGRVVVKAEVDSYRGDAAALTGRNLSYARTLHASKATWVFSHPRSAIMVIRMPLLLTPLDGGRVETAARHQSRQGFRAYSGQSSVQISPLLVPSSM
jgi:hypothetical protein